MNAALCHWCRRLLSAAVVRGCDVRGGRQNAMANELMAASMAVVGVRLEQGTASVKRLILL